MVRPTYVQVTPRFFSTIHSEYLEALARACHEQGGGSVGKELDPESVPAEIRERVMGKFKGYLGGRQGTIFLAGAITSSKVRNFVGTCFDNAVIMDLYGTSEVRECKLIN